MVSTAMSAHHQDRQNIECRSPQLCKYCSFSSTLHFMDLHWKALKSFLMARFVCLLIAAFKTKRNYKQTRGTFRAFTLSLGSDMSDWEMEFSHTKIHISTRLHWKNSIHLCIYSDEVFFSLHFSGFLNSSRELEMEILHFPGIFHKNPGAWCLFWLHSSFYFHQKKPI